MGERRCAYRVFVVNLMEKGHLEDLDIDGEIIWVSKKWDWGGAWTGLIWLRRGRSSGHL